MTQKGYGGRFFGMRRTILLLTAVVTVSACSTTSTWTASLPPNADPAVAEVMPKGAYTVSGGSTSGGVIMFELEGFVDFGSKPDGVECEADYTTTVASRFSAAAEDGTILATRAVRSAGKTEWYSIASSRGEDSRGARLEWRDAEDPGASYPPLLFFPWFISSEGSNGVFEGAGNGLLCSIGVMPRFMELKGDRLVFDTKRVEATVASKNGRHVAQLLTTLGISGSRYDRVAEPLTKLYGLGTGVLTGDPYLTIADYADDGFEIVQFYLGKPSVILTFTPVEDRVVLALDEPTYFERLAEKAKRGDREVMLREAIKDRAGLLSLRDEESSDGTAEPAWLTDLLR
jgi:hypothetical protein